MFSQSTFRGDNVHQSLSQPSTSYKPETTDNTFWYRSTSLVLQLLFSLTKCEGKMLITGLDCISWEVETWLYGKCGSTPIGLKLTDDEIERFLKQEKELLKGFTTETNVKISDNIKATFTNNFGPQMHIVHVEDPNTSLAFKEKTVRDMMEYLSLTKERRKNLKFDAVDVKNLFHNLCHEFHGTSNEFIQFLRNHLQFDETIPAFHSEALLEACVKCAPELKKQFSLYKTMYVEESQDVPFYSS